MLLGLKTGQVVCHEDDRTHLPGRSVLAMVDSWCLASQDWAGGNVAVTWLGGPVGGVMGEQAGHLVVAQFGGQRPPRIWTAAMQSVIRR